MVMAAKGYHQCISTLVAHGADVNAVNKVTLHNVCGENHATLIRFCRFAVVLSSKG